jgi:hypothetical protein
MSVFAVASSPGTPPGRSPPIPSANLSSLTPLPGSVVVPLCQHQFPAPFVPLKRTRARSKETKTAVDIEPYESCDLHRKAEKAARDYLRHLDKVSYCRKWDVARIRIAQYAASHGGTGDCSELYVFPQCAAKALEEAESLAEELEDVEAAATSDATTQFTTTNVPRPSEQLAGTLEPAPRTLTFAPHADTSTAPKSYTHIHRDENSYRADRYFQRIQGADVYEPGQWAAPSGDRWLNTSGYAIDGWGEEEDGKIGDIEREHLEAERDEEVKLSWLE